MTPILYVLVATFFVGPAPQSIVIGRFDAGFCNAQAAAGNKLWKSTTYRCIPAGPFSADKIPQ